MYDFNHLLTQYRSLWNNRSLTGDQDAEQTLKEAITRELKDENSHPRIRKPLHEKYFFAIKRVLESSLSQEDKLSLISLHTELVESQKEA